MKDTLLINLFGPPGTGKTTIRAETFAKLKWLGIDCDEAPEFAKELVWEKNFVKLESQPLILGEQYHRIKRLYGQVDIILTDGPMLNFMLFDESLNGRRVIKNYHDEFKSINILLKRTKPYNPNGRTQTEKESDELGFILENILVSEITEKGFVKMPAIQNESSDKIIELIFEKIKSK